MSHDQNSCAIEQLYEVLEYDEYAKRGDQINEISGLLAPKRTVNETIYRNADGAAVSFSICSLKSSQEVDGVARRFAVTKGYEHDFVADGVTTVPAPVLSDKNAFSELRTHGRM